MVMNTITQANPAWIERSDFIEILSDEFTGEKGFGAYAYLTFQEIEHLYSSFLNNTVPARAFIRVFVRNY
jgi:hypothetical protein